MSSFALGILAASLLDGGGSSYGELVAKGEQLIAQGKHKEAVDALSSALKINGDDGQIWIMLGQTAVRAGLHREAIAAGEKVLEVGAFGAKVKPAALYEMACSHLALGEKEQAWTRLTQAMKEGWRDMSRLRSDERLKALHSRKGWEDLALARDVKKMSRVEGWRYDLWALDRELRRLHYRPYLRHSPQQRDEWVKKIHKGIPGWTDEKIQVEFFRYVASFGDGHTRIGVRSIKRPRLSLFWFPEGIVVTSAHPDHRQLVGATLEKVEGRPVKEALDLVEPLVFRENPQGFKAHGPNFATNPVLLKGLGVGSSLDSVRLAFRTPDGREVESVLPCTSEFRPTPNWVFNPAVQGLPPFKNRQSNYWFEWLPESNILYFQYNSVASNQQESISAFANRLFAELDKKPDAKMIIDVRWNGGGNTFLSQPLLTALWARPAISQSGDRLAVITGRNTYSAAQNFTTDLERSCRAIFVGEPTGSSPNFIGESVPFTLPFSGLAGTVSDLYWQRSWPMDDRIWIAPQVPAAMSLRDFREGRDPAFEAAQAALNS